MQVVELALLVDEAVGEAVGGGIECSIGLEVAASGEHFAVGILDGEGYPGLVEITLLGDERMADALVLNHDGDGEVLACVERDGSGSEGSDEAGLIGGGGVGFDGEEVDVEGSIFEEGGEALGLLVEVVVLRDERVSSEPAVRCELSVFGPGVRQGG